MIAISARVELAPGDIDSYVQAAAPVVPVTREEKGCLLYAMARDIREDNVIWISEEWETEEDLFAHLRSDHIREFLARTETLEIRAMEVRKYEVSSVGPLEMPQS